MSTGTRVASRGATVCLGLFLWAGLAYAQSGAPAPSTAPAGPLQGAASPATQKAPAEAVPPESAPDTASAPGTVRTSTPGVFDVLNFQGTDLRLALRLLSTQGHRNIVTTKEVTGTVTADLYNVTFKEALEAVLRSTGYAYLEKDSFIYVMTPEQFAAARQAERKVAVRTFHLTYITAADAKALIAPAMSAEASIAVTPSAAAGIATSSSDTGGNSLAIYDTIVVRDYEDDLDRIEDILRKVDVKPDQVLVEATILRATLNETNQLGIDFHALAGVDFETMNSTSTGLNSLTRGTLDSVSLPNKQTMNSYQTAFASGVDPGGLTIGFLQNNIGFFIRALEGVTDVTVLANPKLLIVNKQRGEVMVGNKDGYLTTTVTETVATQTVQFLETGTRLIVRPFVGKDGMIRMEIHPEDSSGSVGQVGASVLPSESTTEVTSNVLVRDGHTIVIGGLFRERTANGRSQVPLFGNIPYLGTLFRLTSDVTVREEVIILITPRIVRQELDEAVSEQIKDDVERFRIGQRKGLRWWGRDRLAQACMRQAQKHLQAGQRALTLWDVDMALSLSPRMEEAIRLKERLTGKPLWADEPQVSSVKYVIQRMIMNELGKPVEQVIPPGKPRDASDLDPDVRESLDAVPRLEQPLPEALPRPRAVKQDDPPAPPARTDEPTSQPAEVSSAEE